MGIYLSGYNQPEVRAAQSLPPQTENTISEEQEINIRPRTVPKNPSKTMSMNIIKISPKNQSPSLTPVLQGKRLLNQSPSMSSKILLHPCGVGQKSSIKEICKKK